MFSTSKGMRYHDFRSFYSSYFKGKKKPKHNFEEMIAIYREFFYVVTDAMFNSKAGVYIPKFGYFYVHRVPFRVRTNTFRRTLQYRPCFIPTSSSPFKYYGFDFTNQPKLDKGIRDKLKKGHRYLNLVTMVHHDLNYYYMGANMSSLIHYRFYEKALKYDRYKKDTGVIIKYKENEV